MNTTVSVPFRVAAHSRVSTLPPGDGGDEGVEAREAREFFTTLGYVVLPGIVRTLRDAR